MRFKKTEICQACSKIKNVCQTCLLDLHYHLPVQVRDSLLKIESSVPKMETNRLYLTQRLERELALRDGDSLLDYGTADPVGKEVLKSIARTKPYYRRNLPHVCSFFVKGTCNRGAECPYRYLMLASAVGFTASFLI
jgi:pre-mRNA-splicing factor RBM22/SLT11